MGCDIHSHAEKRNAAGKWEPMPAVGEPFDWRQYGMFGFFADVRNYSAVPPLAKDRGIPDDASEAVKEDADSWSGDGHSHSWLSMEELLTFNYDAPVEDRRVTVQVAPNAWDGGRTAQPGGGKQTTYREFLGPKFFEELERLRAAGVERIVFWFDN